jgi:hypothetical protein
LPENDRTGQRVPTSELDEKSVETSCTPSCTEKHQIEEEKKQFKIDQDEEKQGYNQTEERMLTQLGLQ